MVYTGYSCYTNILTASQLVRYRRSTWSQVQEHSTAAYTAVSAHASKAYAQAKPALTKASKDAVHVGQEGHSALAKLLGRFGDHVSKFVYPMISSL